MTAAGAGSGVVRWLYPVETLVVATGLAIFPYLLLRGPITRIGRNSSTGAART